LYVLPGSSGMNAAFSRTSWGIRLRLLDGGPLLPDSHAVR
jgi:hypothetical protein